MLLKRWGVLLDLDQTLILTDAIEPLRRRRAWSKVYESFAETTLPPGTHEFLAKVGALAELGVVTTSPKSYAVRLLSYHRLRLPVLVAYHDVAHRKPDPEPILKAAVKLGVEPGRCIHVGDQLADIEAALSAGAAAVALSWDGALDKVTVEGKATAYCTDWDEVYEVIATIVGA
jgi:HAD superfamily hydrolase (TIGR01549 family)